MMFGGRNNDEDPDPDPVENPEKHEEEPDSKESESDGMQMPGLGSIKRSNKSKKEIDPAEELKHKDLSNANELEKILKENPEIIEQYNMTWSIQQVQGFLPNINPSYIRARTEKAKTEAMQEANGNSIKPDHIIMISVLGFVAAIIYVIIQQGGSGGGAGGGPAQDVAKGAGASISLLGASLRQKYSQWRTE